MRLNVRFAGAGGQGVILSSVLLAKAYGLGEDLNISQTQSYGPEARGGACKAEVVISDEYIDYMKVDDVDVFIAYNQTGYDKYCSDLEEKDMVLINSTLVEAHSPNLYEIPGTKIAEEMGKPQVVNMVMLGALTKLLPGLHYDKVMDAIKEDFPASLAVANMEAFDRGYRYMADQLEQKKAAAGGGGQGAGSSGGGGQGAGSSGGAHPDGSTGGGAHRSGAASWFGGSAARAAWMPMAHSRRFFSKAQPKL